MEKTNDYQLGVQGILTRTKKHNTKIGNYKEHFINERFNFTVLLSNGRIEIPRGTAKDQEKDPSSISEASINKVAATFEMENPNN